MKILIATLLVLMLLSGCAVPPLVGQLRPPATQQTYDTSALLSREDATAIALDHARASTDQVTRLRLELEYDDGRPEYDIEFYFNGRKYEYDIHGESGRIISFDRDD